MIITAQKQTARPTYLAEPAALGTTNTIAVRVVGVPFPLRSSDLDRALNGDFVGASRDFDVMMVNAPRMGDRALEMIRQVWPECKAVAWIPLVSPF